MKILIHAHTTYSNDGELSPQELGLLARRRGYSGVLLADHFESLTPESFRALVESCNQVRDCLMVPGYERSWSGYHVLALGMDEWCDDSDIKKWARVVRQRGGITVLAHPTRYKHSIPMRILSACDAVEVWNSKPGYDGVIGPHPLSYVLLGGDRFPICSQDLHGVRHLTNVGVELEASCGGRAEILECLRSGRYRMTNGIFRFGRCLPQHVRGPLALIHRIRRQLVDWAIYFRRTYPAYFSPRSGSLNLHH